MTEIPITLKEYRDLIRTSVDVEAFADYVRASKHSISREDCARFLRFSLDEDGEGNRYVES